MIHNIESKNNTFFSYNITKFIFFSKNQRFFSKNWFFMLLKGDIDFSFQFLFLVLNYHFSGDVVFGQRRT